MPSVYERLKELADRQGMPTAVLASVAIGQYVSGQMAVIDILRETQEKALAMVEAANPQHSLELGGQR